MKRRLTCIVAVFVVACNGLIIQAQSIKQFSGKKEKFTEEVFSLFGEIQEDSLQKHTREFYANWDSSIINDSEKEIILSFSKCFIDKKARSNPDYYNFLKTINTFLKINHSRESFANWLTALNNICGIRKTSLSTVNKLISATYLLLTENTLQKSPSLIWKASSPNFYYKYDSVLSVVFEKTNVICYSKRDSIKIFETSGKFLPVTSTWKGKNGIVTWERAGYNRDSIFVKFRNYSIDMLRSSYSVDSVMFSNKSFFKEALVGRFEDNVTFIKVPSAASYPVFDSYKKEFFIKNVYPNVDYSGGFSMQGARLVGKGSFEKPAKMDFYRRDTLRLRARSQYFIFRPEKLNGVNTSVTIFMEKDSIYHGDLQFVYAIKNKEVSLMKSDNYTAQSPYLDSYHKIDLNFEQLRWRIDEPIILLTTSLGASIGKAQFESLNFFNNKEYDDLQYYDEINPLVALKKFAKVMRGNGFLASDFADYIKKPIDQVHSMLFPLVVKGFIFYNSASGWIELKDRLYSYIDASMGRIDYDVLRFLSTTNSPQENASIDLRNNDLKIYGMPRVFVSDSQNVVFFPRNETIIMKRNRSFQFDGVVIAGLFTFYGKNFFFNYDSFKVIVKNVDSAHIKVITGYDNFAKPVYRSVENTVQDITGEVYIDKPDNMSGLKANPQYPIFNSYGNSYVYYDYPEIFHGVYRRDRDFFFRIYPYTVDSLDNFRKESMFFKGEFLSAKIFPTIEEKLVLQPDYSLGFKHPTPSEGLAVYGGKGTFIKDVILSNRGLKGNGNLKYLSSNAKSGEINFFPDSLNTMAPEFGIAAVSSGTQYPQVNGKNIYVHWEPYKDLMALKSTDQPFNMINKETSLDGKLQLTSKGLKGSGVMDLTSAVASSKSFTYGYATVDADTSNFKIRSLSKDNKDGFAMHTNNVKSHIDFSKRTGTFKSNIDTSVTQFPDNKYIAKIDEFKWKMDSKELELLSSRLQPAAKKGQKYGYKDAQLQGAVYTSTKFDQDSLNFVSPQATFNYATNEILAQKVKYIDVADARLFPDKEIVTIHPNAKMLPLVNCKILANTETRFHNFYKATANVESRNKYGARGTYDYIDEKNKVQPLLFSSISVDSSLQTVATGDILEPDNFTLSPDFLYQGKVNLKSANKFLHFDGSVHIIQNCTNYSTSWFNFESEIDPINVSIPVGEKLVELNRKIIVLGSLITTDSIHVYSSFFGQRKNHSDSLIVTSGGFLQFNKDSAAYMIASKEKLKKLSLPGQLISFKRNTCMHHGEGKVDLGVDLGQFKMKTAGSVDHNLETNRATLRVSMALDFMMLESSMQSMALMIDSIALGEKIDISRPYYKKNLSNIVDTAELRKYYSELSAVQGKPVLPTELASSIFINDIKLVWDDYSNSYRSYGKIGIGFINKRAINKYVEGYVEVWRKRTGDIFDLYLKINDNLFYYFGYTRGNLQVLSSDKNGFNDPIRILKDSERTRKTSRGQTPYSYLVSTPRKFNMVVQRWQAFKEGKQQQPQDIQEEEQLQEQEQPQEQEQEGEEEKKNE